MMNDFFLMERAAQVQRLRSAKSGNHIEIPGRMSRVGHSRRARRLFHMIDQICAMPLREKRATWLARIAERGIAVLGLSRSGGEHDDDSILLTPKHRDLLTAFERQAVDVELEHCSDSPADNSVVTAILRDYGQFNGLKPMQFHSDNFAHELLFPSWLNLYSALVQRVPETSEPRFSFKQVSAIFSFLDRYEADAGGLPDSELLAALTLVANRCPLGKAQVVIQQLLNLGSAKGHDPCRFSNTIASLRGWTDSAPQLLHVLTNWIVFETSALDEQVQVDYDLGVDTPVYQSLPVSVTQQIRTLGENETACDRWAKLLGMIASLYERGGYITPEYAEFLERRTDDLGEWLSFLLPEESVEYLSATSQRLLVKMAAGPESPLAEGDLPQLFAFARIMAPRLRVLHGTYLVLFEKEFVQSDANRALLLRCADDDLKRQKIAQTLVAHAKKSSDRNRIIGRLIMAAVIDPAYDREKLAAIERTVIVLTTLEENGFISTNQLEGLATDIRRRLPESREFFAAPYMGASEGEERLAKLYLALYEECEKFEQYGETGNFGLTMAAYANLDRSINRGD